MKRIIIAALTTFALGAVQAEYTIKQPLEQAQGGSLPSGSIQFSASSTAPPQEPKECIFQPAGEGTLIYIFTTLQLEDRVLVDVNWGSVYLSGFDKAYLESDGYRYTSGEAVLEDGGATYYQVCREPI